MQVNNKSSAFILGIFIFLGLAVLGYFLATAAIDFKQYDRSVTVKGLSEREYKADIVIWPIEFTLADNDLEKLYRTIEGHTFKIKSFLEVNNVRSDEITFSSPSITDKTAQQYGGGPAPQYRYSAIQTVTVYSKNIDAARAIMGKLSELGKQGIVFSGGGYEYQTEYIFTRLNEVKPEMIEEATRKAREVAEKFASDSQSKLGKIKNASQGQFSIHARDKNNPHIKKVRVVSTVQYYLSD
jgi:hypothetical protein